MVGSIQIGDRILKVNGISLVGVTHKQAVETIKMAPHRTRLILDRSVSVNVPKSSGKKARSHPPDQPFVVELSKGVGGLGLSLVGGKGAGEEHGGELEKLQYYYCYCVILYVLVDGNWTLKIRKKVVLVAGVENFISYFKCLC